MSVFGEICSLQKIAENAIRAGNPLGVYFDGKNLQWWLKTPDDNQVKIEPHQATIIIGTNLNNLSV